jgi:hypothetical protein
LTRIVWIVREHDDAVTLTHTVRTERKHHDPLAIRGQEADALPGRLATGAGAAALILGQSRLGADHLRQGAMIRSRGLGAVAWSNVGVTAKGAQGVAMSLVAQIGRDSAGGPPDYPVFGNNP